MTTRLTEETRFRAAHFLFWAMSAAVLGYWVMYFEGERQLAASEIGVMMSLSVGAALVGQYAFGLLCDHLRSSRWPIVAAALSFAAVAAALPLVTGTVWIRVALALLGFFQQPIGPMLDAWTLRFLDRDGAAHRFGRIRGFGSLGWAVTALATAFLVVGVSWNALFIVAVVAAVLLAAVVAMLPAAAAADDGRMANRASFAPGRALARLGGNPRYVFLLAVVFLMYLGVQTTFNYQGLLIKGAGGGVIELGWTFFFGVMCEMPAMFLAAWWLPRSSPRRLMIVAGILYMVRYALIIFFQTAWIVTATACLEGLAFGLLLSALRAAVFAVVDEEVQTLAMTVVDATFLGLTVLVGGVVGGWVIERSSVFHLVAACAACSGIAVGLLMAGGRFDVPAAAERSSS